MIVLEKITLLCFLNYNKYAGLIQKMETDGTSATPWCRQKRTLREQGQRGIIK